MEIFEANVNERFTFGSVRRMGGIFRKAILEILLGPSWGQHGAFDVEASYDKGVLWGMKVSEDNPVSKDVLIAPGSWTGYDTTITDDWLSKVTQAYKGVEETLPIPDASASNVRIDLITVPYRWVDIESNADIESRNFKNPSSDVVSNSNTAKRKTLLLGSVTRTAGVEDTGGAENPPAIPSNHIVLAEVQKRDTQNVAASDIKDFRQFATLKHPSEDPYAHDGSGGFGATPNTYDTSGLNQHSGLGVAKAGGILTGTGATDLTITRVHNIKSATRVGAGAHDIVLNQGFGGVDHYWVIGTAEAVAADRIIQVQRNTGSTFSFAVRDAAGAGVDLTAGQSINFAVFGLME